MEMTINPIATPEDASSLAAQTQEPATLVVIRTGNSDCLAHFFPALYQLNLMKAGHEEKVDLGFSGSRLLERLLQAPGEVISREELMSYAWADRVVGQGSLNQQIYTLRQILGDEKDREIIQTLPRRGYMLNPKYIDSRITLEADTTGDQPLENANNAALAEQPNVPAISASASYGTLKPGLISSPVRRKQLAWMGLCVVGLCAAGLFGWFLLKLLEPPRAQQPPTTNLNLTYAPEKPEQLKELEPLGAAVVTKVQLLTQTPLQLILGLHNDVLTVVCLHEDGSAHSLHLAPDSIAGLTKADLAECL